MKQWGVSLFLAGAALRRAAASALVSYTIQPIVKAGDPIGALQIPPLGGEFAALGLANNGRLDFFTWTNPDASDPHIALVEESGGQLAPSFGSRTRWGALRPPLLTYRRRMPTTAGRSSSRSRMRSRSARSSITRPES